MRILHRTVKFCWSFGIQFTENVQANWQEGYCFIMSMPDPIRPEQPRRKFKNYSGDFLSIRLYSPDLAPSDFHLFDPLENHLGGKYFAHDEEVETEVAEITVKRLLCCGFRRTGKAMRQVCQCWRRICREINVFHIFEYHVLCFISICDLFTDSPSYLLSWTH
jgi:hypothetical protein